MTEANQDEVVPRPAVMRFAVAMEQALRRNEYKGGWEGLSNTFLLSRLHSKQDELEAAAGYKCIHCGTKISDHQDPKMVVVEAVHVANFAMMIFDNATRKVEAKTDE